MDIVRKCKAEFQHHFTKGVYFLWRRIEESLSGTWFELPFTFCGFHWLYQSTIIPMRKSAREAKRIFTDGTRGPEVSGPICDLCAVLMERAARREFLGSGEWEEAPDGTLVRVKT